jgi:hypothetical protein
LVNTGVNTVITGDAATTSTASLITGFHDAVSTYTEVPGSNIGLVTGTIYASDAPIGDPAGVGVTATAAAAAALVAYNDLAGRLGGLDVSVCPGCGGGLPGELGGRTLAPGLYKSTVGSYDIFAGDLTLDPQGDADAVWVFQMPASTLKLGDGVTPRSVILLPSAQAKNVFWQVGSAATISDITGGGTMVGTIISSATTTFSTVGQTAVVTLNGRALVLSAGATMNNTVVNVPAP